MVNTPKSHSCGGNRGDDDSERVHRVPAKHRQISHIMQFDRSSRNANMSSKYSEYLTGGF